MFYSKTRHRKSFIHGFDGSHAVINGSNSAYCSKYEMEFSETFDVFKHRRSIRSLRNSISLYIWSISKASSHSRKIDARFGDEVFDWLKFGVDGEGSADNKPTVIVIKFRLAANASAEAGAVFIVDVVEDFL